MRPLYDHLLVKNVEEIGKIEDQDHTYKCCKGTVVSVGHKVQEVKVGETIVFNKYAGTEMLEYLILREEEILCIYD